MKPRPNRRAGFTLIELVLAIVILGGSLAVLYRSVTLSANMIQASREREEVAYVLTLGELEYPLRAIENLEDDAEVRPDSSLLPGYTYARTLDEKEDPPEGVEDDGLRVLRVTVTWAGGKQRQEIVRYVRETE